MKTSGVTTRRMAAAQKGTSASTAGDKEGNKEENGESSLLSTTPAATPAKERKASKVSASSVKGTPDPSRAKQVRSNAADESRATECDNVSISSSSVAGTHAAEHAPVVSEKSDDDTGVLGGPASASKKSTVRPSMFADPWYLLLLLFRLVAVFVFPGFVDMSEFFSVTQTSLYKGIVFNRATKGMEVLDLVSLNQSAVPAYVMTMVPFAILRVLFDKLPDLVQSSTNQAQIDWIQAYLSVVLPRLNMFVLSVIADACFFHSFRFVRYEHARAFLLIFGGSWTAFTVMVRPSLSALYVVLFGALSFSILGFRRRGNEFVRMGLLAFVFALGLNLEFGFVANFVLVVYFILTVWSRSEATIAQLIGSVLFGMFVFAGSLVFFFMIDSLHYGFFKVSHFEQVFESLPLAIGYIIGCLDGSGVCRGSLAGGWHVGGQSPIFIPWRSARHAWSLLRNYRKEGGTLFAPEVLFVYLPIALGPLLIAALRELYLALYDSYKEIRSELKKMGRDDTSGGTRRKRKSTAGAGTKKARTSQARTEDWFAFNDFFQTQMVLYMVMETVFGGNNAQFSRVVPMLAPAAIISIQQIRATRIAWILVAAYMFGATIFSGAMYNSGSIRSGLDIVSGSLQNHVTVSDHVIPPHSHLVYFHAMQPPSSILMISNPAGLHIHHYRDENETIMYEKIHEWLNLDLHVYVVSVPEFELKHQNHTLDVPLSFNKIGFYNMHLSSGHVPSTLDDMVRNARLSLYESVHSWENGNGSDTQTASATGRKRKSKVARDSSAKSDHDEL